jgi:Myb-like DNA-binding domain
MAKSPAMHYKPWTPAEVRALKKLARQKLGLSKIAKEMKRTPWSVRNRAVSEGISLSTR